MNNHVITKFATLIPHTFMSMCTNVSKKRAAFAEVMQQSVQHKIFASQYVEPGGALVETMTFNLRVAGSTPALAATQGPWTSPLPAVACALRRETPIQYPCYSRERL